ncbi:MULTISPECIES: membrane protein insertion efficiency factor YidD [unclassified Marinobacter]|uniref:membrane protein insertion efficiency factor YidD n=1 Tax=unclassified Marinobacter TaxID=83889 RepID=UPI001267CDF2|nr:MULTISPECIES: membrane protein insertion efficiency factor YidD [unclassified Marinobacter]
MIWLSVQLIGFYRLVAPKSVRQSCRFEPSCSEYAIAALRKYGFLKGWQLTLFRLKRCCPPNGGEDWP